MKAFNIYQNNIYKQGDKSSPVPDGHQGISYPGYAVPGYILTVGSHGTQKS